jgi:stress response protein SCP2
VQLRAGANAAVPTQALTVTLSWPAGGPVDLDLCALLLGADGRVRDDWDLVFYNQPVHPDGAVRHLGREQSQPGVHERLGVDLTRLEPTVHRVVLVAAGDGGPVAAAAPTLAVQAEDRLLAQFTPTLSRETAALLVELYRRDGGWRVRAVGLWTGRAGNGFRDQCRRVTGRTAAAHHVPGRVGAGRAAARDTATRHPACWRTVAGGVQGRGAAAAGHAQTVVAAQTADRGQLAQARRR